MIRIKANFPIENYKTKLVSEDHEIIADEPLDLGGKNTGMQPTELLCAALASCTTITLKMVGDRKGWDFSDAYVEVILMEKEDKTSYLYRIIHLSSAASQEMKDRSLAVANKCPVHKLLEKGIEIITEIKQ